MLSSKHINCKMQYLQQDPDKEGPTVDLCLNIHPTYIHVQRVHCLSPPPVWRHVWRIHLVAEWGTSRPFTVQLHGETHWHYGAKQ